MSQDLEKFGMPEEELFAPVNLAQPQSYFDAANLPNGYRALR